METQIFIHKKTGKTKTQISIMELNEYRKATEEEYSKIVKKTLKSNENRLKKEGWIDCGLK